MHRVWWRCGARRCWPRPCWRAGRGYRHHPQLLRFRDHAVPRLFINYYLRVVFEEAAARGYRFDRNKIGPSRTVMRVPVTAGQLSHEWRHLRRKLARRSPAVLAKWRRLSKPEAHPAFRTIAGPVADWERTG